MPARRLPRRPGERREPLHVPGIPRSLAGAAAERGLELDCAVELCLERALILRDLDVVRCASLYPRLLALADAARVRRPLPTVKGRYLQALVRSRECLPDGAHDRIREDDVTVNVPLRLFPRVVDVVESADLDATALGEALRLEIAAVSDGRTMSEWAALSALALTR